MFRRLALGVFAPLAALLAGAPVGGVYPGLRRLPPRGGRDHALAALVAYVTSVPVADPEREGQTFTLGERNVHAGFANPEHEPQVPAAGVVASDATLNFDYLGGQVVLDDTLGRWGHGTVLVLFGWHREPITLELWCRDVPQRSAVVAALEFALAAEEGRGSVDLLLPCYYGRKARFTLTGSWVIEDPESLRGGRWRALLKLTLAVPKVLLVDAGTMRPMHRVEVVG